MKRAIKITILLTAFLTGIGLGNFWETPNLLSWVALCFVLFLYFLGSKIPKFWWWISLALFLGMARVFLVLNDVRIDDVQAYVALPGVVEIEGKVVADPEVVQGVMKLLIETESYTNGSWHHAVQGKILVKLPPFFQVQWGDRVYLKGNLRLPENTDTFAYAGFLAEQDVYVLMKAQFLKVKLKDENFYDQLVMGFWRILWGFRAMLFQRLNVLFPEPVAGIMAGLLLGLRSSISQAILDDFNHTGLSHILAISGFNISLLIQVFGVFSKTISRGKQFWLTFLGIVFFSLLTGFSPSVLRAAYMGILVVFARFVGRKSQVLVSLLLSGCVMIFLSPFMLSFDLSFQLSFFATLGLVLALDFVEAPLQKLPPWVREGLGVTLAAQVFTLPILLNSFGRFSIISPLANVLVLPSIPLLMLFGFLALMASFCFFPLGQLLAALAWLATILMLQTVHLLAEIPFASLEILGLPVWIFLFYLLVVGFILFRKSKLGQSYFPGRAPPFQ